MNQQNPLITNTLLAIIAALLLVLVIQGRQGSSQRPILLPASQMGGANPDYHLQNAQQQQMPSMGNLIERALKAFPAGCEGRETLADCNSSDAKKVKAEIEKWQDDSPSPRVIFDKIIEKYGEKALTEQALQIRKQMRSQQQQQQRK